MSLHKKISKITLSIFNLLDKKEMRISQINNKKKVNNVLDEKSKYNFLKTHVKAVGFTCADKIRKKNSN